MAKLNKPTYNGIKTYEGAPAKRIGAELELRRTMLATLLWEDSFYENGEDVATRIQKLVPQVENHENLQQLAIDAREKQKLRHVPLLLAREMARHKHTRDYVANTLARIIQRPDELAEFLAIYWKDKKQPLSAQVKKGLARAFTKFDGYQLAKWNKDGAIKLRDVLFLCHAKPKNSEQEQAFQALVQGSLPVPDTWETAISATKGDKAEKTKEWARLLEENKMGALAILRNLRNFRESNVDQNLVRRAIQNMKTERVLPFRFIAAAKYAPELEDVLEQSMFKCLEGTEILQGRTVLLVDVSGSMDDKLSGKSEMSRLEAACGLGMLIREISQEGALFTFSNQLAQVPPRRGFALRDAIVRSQPHGGTDTGQAVNWLNNNFLRKHDRLIVITDEQSHTRVPDPVPAKSYVINVASYKNGIGYGKWTHIDGWSEAIIDYIREFERME